jgi:2-hydroxy-3-keto-5-methylthiopentenyl-1-phosphate phosphatase
MRLVLDWDGTVTEVDTLHLVLEQFGDRDVYARSEAELDARRMTLNDVIAAEFATVTAPLEEVVAYVVDEARVRPGFAELARARHPLVVSSGFHELIEPVLAREGVLGHVELRANHVEAQPDGWVVHFRVDDACGECGEPCKRSDLPDGEVVYAGDGHSDYCAALAADRVFATGTLATWLERRGVAFTPLTDFHALASEL